MIALAVSASSKIRVCRRGESGYNRIKQEDAVLFPNYSVYGGCGNRCARVCSRSGPAPGSPSRQCAPISELEAGADRGGLPKKPVTDPEVRALIEEAAKSFEISPLLVDSVVQVESNYNPFALSPKGAQGLMQLMPATARRFGVSNPYDPRQNIEGGVRY